jgi:hypothetical protein
VYIPMARRVFGSRTRVWLGELPDLTYPVVDVLERTLEAGASPSPAVRRVAIEALLPHGARASYGLLGAEFTPRHSGQLVVQVAISGRTEQRFVESLASRIDDVRVGMLHEYANSVLDGVSLTTEARLVGPGLVRFDRAAHGAVGSNQWLFQRLSAAIVRLLAGQPESPSDEDLAELLRLSLR